MKGRIFVSTNRLPEVIKELGKENVNIIENDQYCSKIEIELDEMTVLKLFHAGVSYGMKKMMSVLLNN